MEFTISDIPIPSIFEGRVVRLYPLTYINKHDQPIETWAVAYAPVDTSRCQLTFSRKKKLFFLIEK